MQRNGVRTAIGRVLTRYQSHNEGKTSFLVSHAKLYETILVIEAPRSEGSGHLIFVAIDNSNLAGYFT